MSNQLSPEQVSNIVEYAIHSDGKTYLPASPLDNVFKRVTTPELTVRCHSVIDGTVLGEDRTAFYDELKRNIQDKKYLTTDHCPISVEIPHTNGAIYAIYVSLDNSVRANMNGEPLYKRLKNICKLVNNIIAVRGSRCIFFFSEACRPSFLSGMTDKKNITYWWKMRQQICQNCSLQFIYERTNNSDPAGMAFGVSAFCTPDVSAAISSYFSESLLNEGFGSAAVGVKIEGYGIVWGIHFPLDFNGDGKENLGYKTMVNLQDMMNRYTDSMFAFGDFNTIPGKIDMAIRSAIKPEYHFQLKDVLTFFASHFDNVSIREGTVLKTI